MAIGTPGAGWGEKPNGFGKGPKLAAMSWRKASAVCSSLSKCGFGVGCSSGGDAEGINGVGGMAAGALSLGIRF
jgi:hypothetical protein